jgi:N-acetylneuraminic acid mutarotase
VWKQLQPRGEIPAPRAGHVSALVGNQLVVFGGVDKLEKKLFNDICVLDLGKLF